MVSDLLRKSKAVMSRVWTRIVALVSTGASAVKEGAARLRRGPLYPALIVLAVTTFAAKFVQSEGNVSHEVLSTVCMASVLAFTLLDTLANRTDDVEGHSGN